MCFLLFVSRCVILNVEIAHESNCMIVALIIPELTCTMCDLIFVYKGPSEGTGIHSFTR